MNFPVVEMLPKSASWAVHLQQEAEDEEVEELVEGRARGGKEKEEIRGESPVYQFFGNSAAKLPDSFLPPGTLQGDATFTLVFWFRYQIYQNSSLEVIFHRAGGGGEGHHKGQVKQITSLINYKKKEIKISNFYFCKRLFQYFLISNSETPWSYYWHFSLGNI